MGKEMKSGSSELMMRILHYAGVLTAVCLLSGAGVSLLYVANVRRIEMQAARAFEKSLEEVIEDAVDPREVVEGLLWAAELPDDGGVRYVAKGSARGYQSEITVLVSVDMDAHDMPVPQDAVLHRLVALPSAETPGLGENIHLVERTVSLWQAILGRREEPARPRFQRQFSGRSLDELQVAPDNGEIEPITGATETSRAVAGAARAALETIIETTGELYGQ